MSPKQPRGIQTLRDLDLLDGYTDTPSNAENVPPMLIRHIPHLPDADRALEMLQRLHREFYPIIQRRGYRVVLLSELCCCADGDDYDGEGNRTLRRKKRAVSNNILGYNSSSGGVCEIRVRLRSARNHQHLFPYQDVAGTMSHELAHCVHGPHSAQFYKLMDEIQEQHAVNCVRGIVASDSFPTTSHGRVLGGTNTGRRRPQGPPQRLGGNAQLSQWMPPRQAAAMAAEARRMRDEQWCQPCQPVELENEAVSDIASNWNAPDAARNDERKRPGSNPARNGKVNRKRAAVPKTNATVREPAAAIDTIDLTVDDSDESPFLLPIRQAQNEATTVLDENSWSCPHCTLVNRLPVLVCEACTSERTSPRTVQEIATELNRNDVIKDIKDKEVQRSEEEFGFNIYGNTKQKTSTMQHLT